MNQEKPVNYNEEYKKLVSSLDPAKKPTLFLHACCGPCLTYPLTELSRHFKVTVGYINPNIYPQEEYFKRLNELKRFVEGFNKESDAGVQVVAYPFMYGDYLAAVKGLEKEKEGGRRCTVCHTLRMSLAYEYAFKNGFDYFTTVMSVSSKKPSALLNQIGLELEKKYSSTKYLVSDFRKEDGTLKGIKIAKAYNLYRQDYCGCEFSLQAREEEKAHTKDLYEG